MLVSRSQCCDQVPDSNELMRVGDGGGGLILPRGIQGNELSIILRKTVWEPYSRSSRPGNRPDCKQAWTITLRFHPQGLTSSSEAPPPKGFITPQNGATSWRASVQTHESLRGLFDIQTVRDGSAVQSTFCSCRWTEFHSQTMNVAWV